MKFSKFASHLVAALVLSAGFGTAGADTVSGNFNSGGYDTLQLSVAAPSTVDIVFTSGYGDATLSLFNASGAHLLTNDDSNGSLRPHITRNLGVGLYSLLVSYCCGSEGYVNANGSVFASTDGFNSGDYHFGGSATLAGMQAFLDSQGTAARAAYTLTISNAAIGATAIPEPGSVALVGLALFGMAVARRRGQAGKA